ncbi:hypothetical protein MBANPS3_010683 [Mucor bainieri]
MNPSTFSPSPPAESVATPCSPFSWSSSSAPSPSVVESPAEGVKLDIFLCHMCEVSNLKVYTKLADLLWHFEAVHERFAVIKDGDHSYTQAKHGSGQHSLGPNATFQCFGCDFSCRRADRYQQHLSANRPCMEELRCAHNDEYNFEETNLVKPSFPRDVALNDFLGPMMKDSPVFETAKLVVFDLTMFLDDLDAEMPMPRSEEYIPFLNRDFF